MVTYGNSLYVFGGDNGKSMLNDLITYDMENVKKIKFLVKNLNNHKINNHKI